MDALLQIDRSRRRSVGFLDLDGEPWACFLVTYPGEEGGWRGYFAFRPRHDVGGDGEIRTAEIFVESSEGDIDRKARGLGRPLLSGLLGSALHTRERERLDPPALRSWLGEVARNRSREVGGAWEDPRPAPDDLTVRELRSLYASYRMDQVAHLISLVPQADFQAAVERLLDGQSFDFGARDRLQFAMMVVDRIEELLPLPPFEAWVRDYLEHPEAYRVYAHDLHRHGPLS